MSSDADRYDAAYAAKLWALLPDLYRAEDPDGAAGGSPLRELVTRIGAQAAIVRRSIDRLWEDQSIETCDDWLIDYLGQLLATNLVPSLDARARRLDVFKTIYYRRRKGTVALIEELATDVSGWAVRVVEMFRRLGRTRHNLDPAIGRPALPSFSRVTRVGTGPGTLRLGGAPLGDHDVQVRIDLGGDAGVAQWSSSIDGHAWVAQGAARTVTVEAPGGGNVTITLVDVAPAPSFVFGDTYHVAVSADPIVQLQRAQGLVGLRTRTPAGGTADLRDALGAGLSRTAFDELAHTADVRRGRGLIGWHDIPRLGVFAWRLRSLPLDQVTAVRHDPPCDGHFTFDPTGRDVALFAAGDRPVGDQWVSPLPYQMPGPITPDLMREQLTELYLDDRSTPVVPHSMCVFRVTGGHPFVVPVSEISADRRLTTGKPSIDPVRGRLVFPTPPAAGTKLRVSYHVGFSSEIGAGCFDRSVAGTEPDDPIVPIAHAAGGGATLATALAAQPQTGTLVIDDSLTYDAVAPLAATRLVVRADELRRPLVRLASETTAWTITGAADDATLVLDGLFVSGGMVVLSGTFAKVTLRCCTLDPGSWDADTADWRMSADTRKLSATHLRIEGTVQELVLDRCITGPIEGAGGRVPTLTIRESIVQAAKPGVKAISGTRGDVALSRCTLLGPVDVHHLEASESIFTDAVTVDDYQHGCVRFCAYPAGNVMPSPYELVEVPPGTELFTSRAFGDAGYAQLVDTAGAAIAEGAEDGSEMGAFWREKNAIKDRSLLIKFQEFLPLGLEPVIVHVT